MLDGAIFPDYVLCGEGFSPAISLKGRSLVVPITHMTSTSKGRLITPFLKLVVKAAVIGSDTAGTAPTPKQSLMLVDCVPLSDFVGLATLLLFKPRTPFSAVVGHYVRDANRLAVTSPSQTSFEGRTVTNFHIDRSTVPAYRYEISDCSPSRLLLNFIDA